MKIRILMTKAMAFDEIARWTDRRDNDERDSNRRSKIINKTQMEKLNIIKAAKDTKRYQIFLL
jgi:hypothetical protein